MRFKPYALSFHWAGRRCVAASRFTFFKVETLQRFACSMVERADARQGLALRPPPDAAMARARRRSRTPAGRTERQSRRGHRPGHRPGKVRADAPHATRRAGYSPIKETTFELPPSGEYGGAGGVEGQRPLSPHAPRRAGDLPPMPGSSRKTKKNQTNDRARKPFSPHAPRRAGDPPPMSGSGRDAQRNTGSIRPERVTFFKSNTLWLE